MNPKFTCHFPFLLFSSSPCLLPATQLVTAISNPRYLLLCHNSMVATSIISPACLIMYGSCADWQIVGVEESSATTARRFTNPKVHLHPNHVISASVDCFCSTLKLGCMIQHKIYLPSLVWIHIPVAKFYYQINST